LQVTDMNELESVRKEIDTIDREMAELFTRRMHCALQAAAYKKTHALPVLDAAREEEVVEHNRVRVEEPLRPYYEEFLRHTMKLSRDYQNKERDRIK